jgi:thioredoxin
MKPENQAPKQKGRRIMQKLLIAGLIAFVALSASCGNKGESGPTAVKTGSIIPLIANEDEFKRIVADSGDRLLMVDFYADWCPPCKELTPVLEEIATEKKEHVTVYKINVDDNKELAASLGARGIPFLAFIRNQKPVHTMTGLFSKGKYIEAIDKLNRTAG